MENNEYSYKKLRVYGLAKEYVKEVYVLLKKFPKEEQFALCDQLRRAAISVPSNIVEGMSRYSEKEKTHFIEIAYGSLKESECQLDIACDLGYITVTELEHMQHNIGEISKMLSGLRSTMVYKTER